MSKVKQPVTIDGIEFSALIESTETWENEIPKYPTENGFEVSDTIIIKPLTLSMTLYLSNTAVTWSKHNNPNRVQDVIKQLRELYFSKTPVTISTSEQIYKNMAIQSIELSKSLETGTSREIPISFQEIRVTESKTAAIPNYLGRGGATGVNAGTANITTKSVPAAAQEETKSKSSILYGIASGAGLFGGGGNPISGLFGG